MSPRFKPRARPGYIWRAIHRSSIPTPWDLAERACLTRASRNSRNHGQPCSLFLPSALNVRRLTPHHTVRVAKCRGSIFYRGQRAQEFYFPLPALRRVTRDARRNVTATPHLPRICVENGSAAPIKATTSRQSASKKLELAPIPIRTRLFSLRKFSMEKINGFRPD